MPTLIDAIVDNVKRYLSGGTGDAKELLDWRDQLRVQGHPALARAISRRLAEEFIAGKALTVNEVDRLWAACKADEAFSHARRVLRRRIDPAQKNILPGDPGIKVPTEEKLREQAALMTSKDPDLAASVRHAWALEILKADLNTSSAETLGIAGGIWKRRWESDGQISSLEQSLKHYLAPVERSRAPDTSDEQHDQEGRGVTVGEGYPAINAAFVCDLLAHRTEDERNRRAYIDRANNLRRRICDAVKGKTYWVLVTLAEARFGLGEVEEAVRLLGEAARAQPDPWERETTARQLARLGFVRGLDIGHTRRVVSAIVGGDDQGTARVKSVLTGKVGLALSGGGFRASLYHLGVLARLAESGVLRHVEVLSTVSGGSMVGAAYYLRLRRMLTANGTPNPEDFVTLVKDLIEDFRKGTDANLRSSLLMNLRVCHAILSGNDQVYAQGMAEAVFGTLYSRTVPSDPHMGELSIRPADAPADFHPRYHNSERAAKVPALMLNATSLNTGHSWQFTTTSMGESPFSIVAGADPLPRLRRSYYVNQHGQTVRGATLSQAVSASACVPGLFAPLALEHLYEGYEVRLVDGGVYDNQGALALMQEDCNVVIVSDACGQLNLDQHPGGGHVAPLLRSFGIFQERMRQASFERLRAAKDGGRLVGLAYVHLKQDLESAAVDWQNCEDPSRSGDQLPATAQQNPNTSYGVWKSHQALLAEIRTDLDVFSDIESAALMASGYMAMDTEMKRLLHDVPSLEASRKLENWFFLPLIPKLQTENQALAKHLKAGSQQFLRIMQLDSKVKKALLAVAAAAALLLAWVIWQNWETSFTFTVGWVALTLGTFAAAFIVRKAFKDWSWTLVLTNPLSALRSHTVRWLGALGTWALARWVVPRLTARYLELGRLERLEDAK